MIPLLLLLIISNGLLWGFYIVLHGKVRKLQKLEVIRHKKRMVRRTDSERANDSIHKNTGEAHKIED